MPKVEFLLPMPIRLALSHFRPGSLEIFPCTPIVYSGGLRRSCPDPCPSHSPQQTSRRLFLPMSTMVTCYLAGLGRK